MSSASRKPFSFFSVMSSWMALSFLFVFIVFTAFQTWMYKSHALEMSYLYFKELTGYDTALDQKKMGSICNTVKKYSCAKRHFMKAVERGPNDPVSLANLAILMSMKGEYEDAKSYFAAYFATGFEAYDVLKWYARAIRKTEGDLSALPWFYRSFSLDPNKQACVDEIVEILVDSGRPFEALSLVGVATQGRQRDQERWAFIESKLAENNHGRSPASISMERTLLVPNFEDTTSQLPLFSEGDDPIVYLPFKRQDGQGQISKSWLESSNLKYEIRQTQSLVTIQGLSMGSWAIPEMSLTLCEDCESFLTPRDLRGFRVHEGKRDLVSYLIFSR